MEIKNHYSIGWESKSLLFSKIKEVANSEGMTSDQFLQKNIGVSYSEFNTRVSPTRKSDFYFSEKEYKTFLKTGVLSKT